jgi:hypothetical protein
MKTVPESTAKQAIENRRLFLFEARKEIERELFINPTFKIPGIICPISKYANNMLFELSIGVYDIKDKAILTRLVAHFDFMDVGDLKNFVQGIYPKRYVTLQEYNPL